ncbi:hypothetical protein B6P55_24815 [Escherichia coli]|nr:hypothetical protein [Escherichia coli]
MSLRRMVNLTTRCSCGDYMNPRHTYHRAISRIATTGSARSKKFNDKPSKGKTPPPCAFVLCACLFYHFRLGGILEFSHNQ